MVFDKCFQIESIHVVEIETGRLIVAMPTRLQYNKFYDMAHPTTVEFRRQLDAAVMAEYERLRSGRLTESKDSVTIRP